MINTKPTIEELRKLTTEEVESKYGIPHDDAELLREVSHPFIYPIVIDHSLSVKDMSDWVHRSVNTLYHYRSVLVRYGYDEPKKPVLNNPRKNTSSKEQKKILSLLESKVRLIKEIAAETGRTTDHVGKSIRGLKERGMVGTYKINLGMSFFPHKIDEINKNCFAYLPEREGMIGKRLVEYLGEEFTTREKRRLSYFKDTLPDEAAEVVDAFMDGNFTVSTFLEILNSQKSKS